MLYIKQKIMIAYILFILCVSLPVFVEDEPVKAATPWGGPSNFLKYRTIFFDAKFSGYVSNLTVWSTAGHDDYNKQSISAVGCNSNFSDIRFYQSDNSTQFDYWLQIKNETAGWATFWINNSANQSTMNMFYDNADITRTTSNGNVTFWQWINHTRKYVDTKPEPGWLYYSPAGSNPIIFYNLTGVMYFQDLTTSATLYRASFNLSDCLDPLWDSCGVTIEADIYNNWIPHIGPLFDDDQRFNILISNHTNQMSQNVHADLCQHQADVTGENNGFFTFQAGNTFKWIANHTGAVSMGTPYDYGYNCTKMWRIDHNMNINKSSYYIFNLTDATNEPFGDPADDGTQWGSLINATPNYNNLGALPRPNWITLTTGTNNDKGARANFTGVLRFRPFRIHPPELNNFSSVYEHPDHVIPTDVTNVEETTATLNGKMQNDTGVYNTCGFLIGTTNVTSTSWDQNITVGLYNNTNSDFEYNITGLTPGEYYFVKTWCHNGVKYSTSNHTEHFLTKPYGVTVLRAEVASPTSTTVQWVNPVVGAGTNTSIAIYYSESPITETSDGTLANNYTGTGTGQTQTVTGLNESTTYYFAAFTYANASGSPYLYQRADGTTWVKETTTRGNFNVSVYNESKTWQHLNLTEGGPHKIIVVYSNRTEINIINGAVLRNDSVGNWGRLADGWFWLNCTYTPLYIEIRWNETDSVDYRCNRKQLFHDVENISFYMQLWSKVYAITTSELNNETLVPYTYQFLDKTSVFEDAVGLNTYATIFTYSNVSDTPLIIHQEYWDTTNQIYPWLLYGKHYFIGVECEDASIPRLGESPTGDDMSPELEIEQITAESNETYQPDQIFDYEQDWLANGFYVYFLDSTYTTTNLNLSVYYVSNGTLVYTDTVASFTHNWTVVTDITDEYFWILNVTNNAYFDGTVLWGGMLLDEVSNITSYEKLNATFTTILGRTPFRSVEDPTQFVPWVNIAIIFVALLIAFTFSGIHAGGVLTGFSVGIWFIAAGTFVSGMSGHIVGDIIGVGALIIVLSILVAYSKGGAFK